MSSRPQYSIAYLMLLVFCWSLMLAMIRGIAYYGTDNWRGPWLLMFSPISIGAACGGLVLKMRFGFIAGCVISALLWLWVVFWIMTTP
jgi:hypothetical protein